MIGEGSYGRVYHASLSDGRVAAVKKLDTSNQPEAEFLAQVMEGPVVLWFRRFSLLHIQLDHLMW